MTSSSHFIKKSMGMSYALLALGFLFLGWLIYHLGLQDILENFRRLGFNFFTALIPSLLTFFLLSEAWRQCLTQHLSQVPFSKIFMIKVIGEAVNMMTPLSWGGGDPVRIYLLKKWVPVAEGTASVVIDRTLNSMALVVFMIFGVFIAFIKLSLPPPFKIGFILSLFFMTGMTFYWYHRQHKGVFEFLIRCLTRLRIKRNWSEETLSQVKKIDRFISQFYSHHRTAFAASFFLQVLARLLGVIEIYVVAYFLQIPIDWVAAYLLVSLTAIINMIFAFIPGSLGVLEGAYAGAFLLIGQDPAAGTSIQIFRRIRMTLWAALGFYYIYHLDRKTRLELTEIAHHPSLDKIDD